MGCCASKSDVEEIRLDIRNLMTGLNNLRRSQVKQSYIYTKTIPSMQIQDIEQIVNIYNDVNLTII